MKNVRILINEYGKVLNVYFDDTLGNINEIEINVTDDEYKLLQNEKCLTYNGTNIIVDYARKIKQLKNELNDTDYKAMKYFEGLISESEYKPIKEYRQSLRNKINELESKVL